MKKVLLVFIIAMSASCGRGKHMPQNTSATNTPKSEKTTGKQQAQSPQGPTFNEDIRPIFKQYCSGCHRPGAGIPDWLDYKQAFAKKEKIMENDVIKRIMPPKGAPQLSESDIQLIKKWIDDGAPEQKPGEAPVASGGESAIEKTTITIPPVKPTPPNPYKTLFCEQYEKYPSNKVKFNLSFAASLPKDISNSSMTLTALEFDPKERLTAVESNVLLRSTDSSYEVCGVSFSDKKLCYVESHVTNQENAKMDIICESEIPVHLKFIMTNGSVKVLCNSGITNIGASYRNGSCEIRN